jgi:hypothetical protein
MTAGKPKARSRAMDFERPMSAAALRKLLEYAALDARNLNFALAATLAEAAALFLRDDVRRIKHGANGERRRPGPRQGTRQT